MDLRRRGRWSRLGWAWRQSATIAAAIGVSVVMVIVAQGAREDEKHHETVQVLVERIRVTTRGLDAFIWRGLAEAFNNGARTLNAGPFVAQPMKRWNDVAAAVAALRAADHSRATETLLNDAGRLYGAGMSLVSSAKGLTNVRQGMTSTQALFAPALDALDRDAVAASRPVSAEQIEPLLEATLREIPDKAFRACADTDSRTDSSMEMTT